MRCRQHDFVFICRKNEYSLPCIFENDFPISSIGTVGTGIDNLIVLHLCGHRLVCTLSLRVCRTLLHLRPLRTTQQTGVGPRASGTVRMAHHGGFFPARLLTFFLFRERENPASSQCYNRLFFSLASSLRTPRVYLSLSHALR